MIVIELSLNGEVLACAGKEDLCVLTAGVTAAGILGHKSKGTRSIQENYHIDLHLGGLSKTGEPEKKFFYDWVKDQELKAGDKVRIRILEQQEADSPVITRTDTETTPPDHSEEIEKMKWEEAKEFYLKHKESYE